MSLVDELHIIAQDDRKLNESDRYLLREAAAVIAGFERDYTIVRSALLEAKERLVAQEDRIKELQRKLPFPKLIAKHEPSWLRF